MSANVKTPKPKAKKKSKNSVKAIAAPLQAGGSGMPFMLPYRELTYSYLEDISTVSAAGDSDVFYSNITLKKILGTVYPNYVQVFEEFQIRRVRMYLGCCSQLYNHQYTAMLHSAVDLDVTVPGSGDAIDLRANVKIYSCKKVIEDHLCVADFTPTVSLEGNAIRTAGDKVWMSVQDAGDVDFRGFAYYFSWNPETKPVNPQTPPKIKIIIKVDIRFRGAI